MRWINVEPGSSRSLKKVLLVATLLIAFMSLAAYCFSRRGRQTQRRLSDVFNTIDALSLDGYVQHDNLVLQAYRSQTCVVTNVATSKSYATQGDDGKSLAVMFADFQPRFTERGNAAVSCDEQGFEYFVPPDISERLRALLMKIENEGL